MLNKTDLAVYAPDYSDTDAKQIANYSRGQQLQLAQSVPLHDLYAMLGKGMHKSALTLVYGRLNHAYRTECNLDFTPDNSVVLEAFEWFLSDYAVPMPWLGFLRDVYLKVIDVSGDISAALPMPADYPISPLTAYCDDEGDAELEEEDEDEGSIIDEHATPSAFSPYVNQALALNDSSTLIDWAQAGLIKTVEFGYDEYFNLLTNPNLPDELFKLVAGALISSDGIFVGSKLQLIPRCNQARLTPIMAQSFEKYVSLWGSLPDFALDAILLAAEQKLPQVKQSYTTYVARGYKPSRDKHAAIMAALRKIKI